MSRTFTLNDEQSGWLLRIIRIEAMAAYATARERARAEELYQVVTLTPHVEERQPSLLDCAT